MTIAFPLLSLPAADFAVAELPRVSPLRVAIFTDTYAPQMNGVARTLQRLKHSLEDLGHSARVFTPDDPMAAPMAGVVRWPSIPFWAYRELRLAAPSTKRVADALADWHPNLVHVATPFGMGLTGIRAAAKLGIPVVSSYHTSLTAYAGYYGLGALSAVGWRYLRWFHNRTSRTYAPTGVIRAELRSRGFRRVQLWSRGVDARTFHPDHRCSALRQQWGANDHTVVVTYVGRLAREKGVDVAIDAMRLIREQGLEAVFVVVGDGPHEAALRARAPQGTVFTGRLENPALAEAYASSDIVLFPSTTDTFGNVILEAMASGAAVVAADVPQAREVIGQGNGELFPADNAIAMATRISRLMTPRYRELVRRRALARARACTWPEVFEQLFDDYQHVRQLSSR